jgi:tyrosine-protein phosphatase MSG5
MTLPNTRPTPVPRGFAEIPLEDEEEEEETNFDIPQSQEEKPDSYPNGPIRIYESGIDLYYEPSVEVASQYDVIFNVASEVKNPFQAAEEEARRLNIPLVPSVNIGILDTPENAGSPTTPKATPISTVPPPGAFSPTFHHKRPEYIHIPWEHNTDIVPDLHRLVKVIDDRVKQGKKVLVHCQCGVSRSASLIVAYGLYKNPDMSVQEAYNAVKKRSKWIGPNMSLIMQLQEFKSGLTREFAANQSYNYPRKSTTLPSASTTDSFGSKTPSAPPTPRTAPMVPEDEVSPTGLSSNSMAPFSAAPIESTAGSFWEAAFRRSRGSKRASNNLAIPGISLVTDTPYVDTKGHIIPVVTMLKNDKIGQEGSLGQNPMTKSAFKTPKFTRPLPFRKDYDMDTQMTDAPSIEPMISPRSTEFHMAPLVPPREAESFDTFNILSPKNADFSPLSSSPIPSSPPEPRRIAPLPPASKPPTMDSLNSIFSPTVGVFPPLQPLSTELLEPPQSRSSRIDSLVPQSPPLGSLPQPKESRRLRSKFSAPNLTQCIQLQKIQDNIASNLPKRPAEAEEALLSPRATEFVINPFHRLPTAIPEDPALDSANFESKDGIPSTPSSASSDPRSPAQSGLSPITRNIWSVI